MHPVVIVIPATILIFGPRAWVSHLLKKHDKNDLDVPVTARNFAREILDREGLQLVRVESTDVGDHYDQQARAVRLARNRIDRKSLTALTTAAHEVGHSVAVEVPGNRNVARIAEEEPDVRTALRVGLPEIHVAVGLPVQPRRVDAVTVPVAGHRLRF